MAQLVVTIDDSRLLPALEKAIGLLKGVTRVQLVHKDKKKSVPSVSAKSQSDIPPVIKNLIGAASGLAKEEIENDERLSYLLSK